MKSWHMAIGHWICQYDMCNGMRESSSVSSYDRRESCKNCCFPPRFGTFLKSHCPSSITYHCYQSCSSAQIPLSIESFSLFRHRSCHSNETVVWMLQKTILKWALEKSGFMINLAIGKELLWE
jgi:hypothetical protein